MRPRRCLKKDMPWFLDIKDILEKNKNNPHFDVEEAIKNNAVGFCPKRCLSR